jgi:hypothetical protein
MCAVRGGWLHSAGNAPAFADEQPSQFSFLAGGAKRGLYAFLPAQPPLSDGKMAVGRPDAAETAPPPVRLRRSSLKRLRQMVELTGKDYAY